MASVNSLDKDMRNLRMSKYTPQAANEVRKWIEKTLGEQLKPGDLLDALKDGVALCKLVNLAAPSSVRYKESSMPFVQMENISHFLRACQAPPLNLQSHDLFQTVDLYESKDPAQVLQCIAAFSRRAHGAQPSRFPDMIGEKSKAGFVSPQSTGSYSATSPQYGRPRKSSNLSETNSTVSSIPSQAIGGRGSPFRPTGTPSVNGGSPTSSSGGVSSWSKKGDEGTTTPAWNIHQYGYMGGASQGNQGISFGARRQITTAAPKVPSLAEKERKRREQEGEAERRRRENVEAEAQHRSEQEAEEREQFEEEQRWHEATRRQRDLEKQRIQEEKKRWEEEERRWKEEEEIRAKEERETEDRIVLERNQKQAANDVRLTGQFLSQYQAEKKRQSSGGQQGQAAESARIAELERQLEDAKAREAQYEHERQERLQDDKERSRSRSRQPDAKSRNDHSRSKSRTRSVPNVPTQPSDDPWKGEERDYLRKQWDENQNKASEPSIPSNSARPLPSPRPLLPSQEGSQHSSHIFRPLPIPSTTKPQGSAQPYLPSQDGSSSPAEPPQSSRPLPIPQSANPPPAKTNIQPPQPARPLPNPETYTPLSPQKSPRKSPFTRPQATPSPPPQFSNHHPTTTNTSSSQPSRSPATSTPANPLRKPPFANPSSLLAREMELDRQRQQEWEESQKATEAASATEAGKEDSLGSTPGGGAWDVHQYGYLGGDSQNRGGTGIGMGATRRQLVGPRELPGKSRGD